MRILFVVERFPPDLGGVARSAGRIVSVLANLGVTVEVFAWSRALLPGQLQTLRRDDGVCVHLMGLFANWDLSLQHTLNVLEWLHGRAPYAAVFGHYLYPAGFAAVWFAERCGLPSVVNARGNDVDRLMFPPGDFARLQWTLQRASLRTAVSADLARKIDVLLGLDAEVTVLHNAVDVACFCPGPPDLALRAELGIEPEEVVLGFCGELRHKKGLPFLLSALSALRERPARLLVIGEVRARERSQLAEFALQKPEAATRIVETGHLPNPATVAAHLRLCTVSLLPSVWDGLPNALLESMACGLPVIASDAGGMPEVVRHGEDGFLIPRAQLHQLGRAVRELLALSEQQRQVVGAAARARMEADYDGRAERVALMRLLSRLRTLGAASKP